MKKYLQLLLALGLALAGYAQDPAYPPAPVAATNITAAEYFIDSDPGIGAGTSIPVGAAVDIGNVTALVNVNGLGNGVHRLFLRTRNAGGVWSLAAIRDFLYDADKPYVIAPAAAQNIVRAEYFIDTDPGPGAATAIAVTPGLDLAGVSATIPTTGLTNGTHRLYIRTQGAEGRWSLAAQRDFIIDFNPPYPVAPATPLSILQAEYFIDTDPGFGSGTAITITPGVDLADVNVPINTSTLAQGNHRLYLRTRGQEGRWSLSSYTQFIVNSDLAYPASPVAAQPITAAEYFFDTDPGFGSGTSIPLTPGVDVQGLNFGANVAALAEGRHTFYLRTRGQEGRWSLTHADTLYVGVRPPGWTISPAGGHDYGAVLSGTPVSFDFTIDNTGAQPVVLRNAFSTDPAFGVAFTAGTTIPAGGSLTLPVSFTPSGVTAYSGKIRIVSDAGGPDTATVVVTGNGRLAGTPPGLNYVAAQPYGGVRGVSADAGLPGLYTYKIIYRSPTGRAPEAGYPKLGIDANGDGDFDDAGDQMLTMTKEGSGIDYATGVVYSLGINFANYSNTLGYQFFAIDDQGNAAASGNTAYKSGPVITYELLDLKIFANDISFSKSNPLPGEAFTVTANVTNSSAYSVSNVPVKFYKDTILLDNDVIPAIPAFGTASITKVFSFPTDGFVPIKVWIDSARTLSESNFLNNYAIRPVNIGVVILPGGIKATTSATLQSCPQALLISGSAAYFGTASPTAVAGAEVTINTGTQVFTTTTDANGNYSLLVSNPTCGGTMAWTVSVTDFTFTSAPVAGSLAVPCPAPDACIVQPKPGVNVVSQFSTSPCSRKKGSEGVIQLTVTYRARNVNNMWSLWDNIIKDTVKIFRNGVLIDTYWSADRTTVPGQVKTYELHVTLDTTGPNVFEAKQSYVYNEFFQNEDNFYHGIFTPMTGSGTATIVAEDDKPDLTITGFTQTGYTEFNFADANIKCGDAGAHTVQILDSIPGGPRTVIQTYTVSGLSGKTQQVLLFSNSALPVGEHFISIVTDPAGAVAESDETNNVFRTKLVVPKPDLTVSTITASFSGATPGQKVGFMATIHNSGSKTGAFTVSFRAGGVLIGSPVAVTGMPEKGSITVVSDPLTVTTPASDCPVIISVRADDGGAIDESNENNNTGDLKYASDIAPYTLPGEAGSAANPVVVRVNASTVFHPLVRNIGQRDIGNVTVRYTLGGIWIGGDNIGLIRAGEAFAATGTFSHVFAAAGDYVVHLVTDTSGTICEADENNNEGDFHIRVVESNPDLEVLSQYISPGSLNPNPGQGIGIVGTVKNIGLKSTAPNIMRFMVDDIQLGDDVALNALAPGRDTTVAATVNYSSLITGVKIMKILVNPDRTMAEEQFGNNEATRALIVGDAPDLARAHAGAISFNPSGFVAGDSVWISYDIRNGGSQQGTAWLRFRILDENGALTAIDSMQFTLPAGATTTLTKRMFFAVSKGAVIAEIVNCSPMEFDLYNNNDTLSFSTVMKLKSAVSVSGDLDMKNGLPEQLPGWIGGKLMLGDYDLVVNGVVKNFDMSHFIVTDGIGKLRLVNGNAANLFPIGVSETSPNFVKIDNTGEPDNFTVSVRPWILRNAVSGDTVKIDGVNRTWMIEEQVAGGSNASLEFFWSPAAELAGFDAPASRIAHYSGGWTFGDIAAAVADTNEQYSRSQGGYTTFSPFVVISGNGTNLPLRLLGFGVSRKGADALLEWRTTDEDNTSRFAIQHSRNGVSYDDIASVGALNAGGVHDYSYLHPRIGDGLHYYRLKMIDLDGTANYSPVRTLTMNGVSPIVIYPNPAGAILSVKGLPAGGRLMLLTQDGKSIQQWNVTGSTMTIGLERLAAGSYLLRYVDAGGASQLIPFIKI